MDGIEEHSGIQLCVKYRVDGIEEHVLRKDKWIGLKNIVVFFQRTS